MRALVLFLVALVWAAGVARAAPDAADVTTPAPITLPAGAAVDAAWSGIFCESLAEGDALRLAAPRAHVVRHERTRVETGPVSQYVRDAPSAYTLTDVTITLTRASGWIGGVADGDDARLAFSAPAASSLSPKGAATIGNWEGTDADADRLPAFAHAVGHHLLAEAPARGNLSGAMEWKIYGATVLLEAAENTTTWDTGSTSTGVTTEDLWLVVRLEAAHGEIDVAAPCQAALPDARVDASGPWQLQLATGSLMLADEPRPVRAEPLVLDGHVRATLSMLPGAEPPQARIVMSGTMDHASLSGVRLDAPPAPLAWVPWLAAATLVAIVGLAAVAPRWRPEPRLTVEQCTDLADAAAEAGHYESALLWTQRARAQAPDSGRLRMDEAWFLWQLGRIDEALVAADAAVVVARDGQVTFMAALLAAKSGERQRARAHLVVALRQTPCVALDAVHEAAFAELRADPAVASAMERALHACDEGSMDRFM